MKEHFSERLDELRRLLIFMGDEVRRQTRQAVEAWTENSAEKAHVVIQADEEIDRLENRLTEETIRLLALEQPVAVDLRFLVGALKITDSLERTGDHAVNIAESAERLSREPPFKGFRGLLEMSATAMEMLDDSLEAMVSRDVRLAGQVIRRDDLLDGMTESIYRELLTYMMEKPALISRYLELFSIARNLERIGDLATNISEEVFFIAKARVVKHHGAELD